MSVPRGRITASPLTNQTGAARTIGDVVTVSTLNDESFTTSASSNYATGPIGVVDEQIGIGSNGRVTQFGFASSVNVGVNTVSRGQWLYQSTTAGVAVGASFAARGAFGWVTKGGTGTTPSAIIFPPLQSAGGGSSSVSAGSNSMSVGATNQAGVAATFSPSDHRHMGIHSITSSSSNTLQRPTVNIRAGTNVGLTATDSDGDGTFDTITIHSTGTGGGGGGSGLTHAYVGYNTVGGSTDTPGVNSKVYAKSITLANDCLLAGVDAHVAANSGTGIVVIGGWALYEDNAGAPGKVLAMGAAAGVVNMTTTFRWHGFGGIGRWVTAGTYWIAIRTSDTGGAQLVDIKYDGSGSDVTWTGASNRFDDAPTVTTSTRQYSIRVSTVR